MEKKTHTKGCLGASGATVADSVVEAKVKVNVNMNVDVDVNAEGRLGH